MIIETSANQLYSVTESTNPNLSHVYLGKPVKRIKGGFALTASAKAAKSVSLVRKLGCTILHHNITITE
jgi:hypothetical protein